MAMATVGTIRRTKQVDSPCSLLLYSQVFPVFVENRGLEYTRGKEWIRTIHNSIAKKLPNGILPHLSNGCQEPSYFAIWSTILCIQAPVKQVSGTFLFRDLDCHSLYSGKEYMSCCCGSLQAVIIMIIISLSCGLWCNANSRMESFLVHPKR